MEDTKLNMHGIYIGPHSNNPEKPIIYDDPLPSFIQYEDRKIMKEYLNMEISKYEIKNLFVTAA